jgi:putrescine transport system substrate-binding protein
MITLAAIRIGGIAAMLALLAACGGSPEPPQLSFANWDGEIGKNTLPEFQQRTGIHVKLDEIIDNVTLQTRLMTGSSGLDVAVPSSNFFQPLIEAGALRILDRTKLPNWRHLDPKLLQTLQSIDPGNHYGVPYLWGTHGFGYNIAAVTKALGHEPEPSWKLIFDPAYASRLSACGIAYARYIDSSSKFRSDLAQGDICIAIGANGELLQARELAQQSAGASIRYVVPIEGAPIWVDLLAIPAGARHVEAAYRFINFLMEPRIIAEVTNAAQYANANIDADPYVNPTLRGDPDIYPSDEVRSRLHLLPAESLEYSRLRTRMWSRVLSATAAK